MDDRLSEKEKKTQPLRNVNKLHYCKLVTFRERYVAPANARR